MVACLFGCLEGNSFFLTHDGGQSISESFVLSLGLLAVPVPASYKGEFPTGDMMVVVRGTVPVPVPPAAALAPRSAEMVFYASQTADTTKLATPSNAAPTPTTTAQSARSPSKAAKAPKIRHSVFAAPPDVLAAVQASEPFPSSNQHGHCTPLCLPGLFAIARHCSCVVGRLAYVVRRADGVRLSLFQAGTSAHVVTEAECFVVLSDVTHIVTRNKKSGDKGSINCHGGSVLNLVHHPWAYPDAPLVCYTFDAPRVCYTFLS